jgi:hypothetical protein
MWESPISGNPVSWKFLAWATLRQWRQRCTDDLRAIDVRAGGQLKIDQKACGRGRSSCARWGIPSAADQSQWRHDASEFNKLNIDLPKGKLLQNLLRIYIVFNEPNQWILCALFNSWYLERIQVRRIRKWPKAVDRIPPTPTLFLDRCLIHGQLKFPTDWWFIFYYGLLLTF